MTQLWIRLIKSKLFIICNETYKLKKLIVHVLISVDCVNFGQANYTVYEDDNLLEILVEVESGKKASTDIFMQVVDMRSTAGESRTTYV